jgi:hypothetical protein
MERSKRAFLMTLFGLIVSGCASDGKMEPESVSSTSDGGTAVSSSTMSSREAAVSRSTSPSITTDMDRVASGSVEDTLNACLARVPRDASEGQKLLAEQSCRRDFPSRR